MRSSKGSGLVEYTVIAGLISVLSVGAVLAFGAQVERLYAADLQVGSVVMPVTSVRASDVSRIVFSFVPDDDPNDPALMGVLIDPFGPGFGALLQEENIVVHRLMSDRIPNTVVNFGGGGRPGGRTRDTVVQTNLDVGGDQRMAFADMTLVCDNGFVLPLATAQSIAYDAFFDRTAYVFSYTTGIESFALDVTHTCTLE